MLAVTKDLDKYDTGSDKEKDDSHQAANLAVVYQGSIVFGQAVVINRRPKTRNDIEIIHSRQHIKTRTFSSEAPQNGNRRRRSAKDGRGMRRTDRYTCFNKHDSDSPFSVGAMFLFGEQCTVVSELIVIASSLRGRESRHEQESLETKPIILSSDWGSSRGIGDVVGRVEGALSIQVIPLPASRLDA